jgi:hypothetical protein
MHIRTPCHHDDYGCVRQLGTLGGRGVLGQSTISALPITARRVEKQGYTCRGYLSIRFDDELTDARGPDSGVYFP